MADKTEKDVEGVKIDDTSSGNTKKDYAASDVAEIYKDAQPHDWQDVVTYIAQKGDDTWHITPGEAIAMKEDFQHLLDHKAPFTDDPNNAYDEAHTHRQHR
jgi:hypothetical protein